MPEAATTSSSRRRVSDVLALALVAATVGLVSASAAPSVARELGWTSASQSARGDDWREHGLGGTRGRAPVGSGADDPSEAGPRGLRSRERSPHAPSAGMPDLVAPPDDRATDDDTPDARLAVTVRDVVVRERADDGAAPLGRVGAGELLIVIRETGAWAMVAHLGEEGSTTGWVRRGDLAIR